MRKGISVAILTAGILAGVCQLPAMATGGEVVSMRRLTEQEYRNSIGDIFGKDIVVQGVFEPGKRIGGLIEASAAILSVTPVGFDSYSKMADSIAMQATSEKARDRLISCKPGSASQPDDACAAQTFNHYGRMLFRRPLTSDELQSRVKLAASMTTASGSFYAGLRYGLASLLQSSNFLFRVEVAVASGSNDYTLDAYSRAARLSYLFWNTTPDPELLKAAQTNQLASPAGLSAQIDRLMASPRLDNGMRAFFSDMLQLDNFDNVSKDSLLYPKWSVQLAAAAREETLRTTIALALHENGDMRELMTTPKTYINRNLAAIYGVPFDFDADWVPLTFTPQQGRSGIITQISMLSMFSHPGRSSPTERGVALMDIFLCEPTPTPPNNVDFSAVNDTNGPLRTVRERLMAHATNPACASCHTHSDPIGLSLEGFDTIGRPRSTENGKLIDVSATIQGKSFVGAQGLGRFLHDNPKYPACVARKLYSYAKGVDSEDVVAREFKADTKAFGDSGYRIRNLLKAVTESEEFFRAVPPVGTAKSTRLASQ
ncbi:MAG: DUF1592 domain-containing protein [Alphaproteobacteria bacterium]|nr:DUF1592 domain-containing protein [Alphaproteobacteria bacterium]